MPNLCLLIYIAQFEVIFCTVSAPNYVLWVLFSRLGHFSDAESADVVLAAAAYENGIEVAKTNRAAVLELLVRVLSKHLNELDVLLANASFDSHLVALSHHAKGLILVCVFVYLLDVISQDWQSHLNYPLSKEALQVAVMLAVLREPSVSKAKI